MYRLIIFGFLFCSLACQQTPSSPTTVAARQVPQVPATSEEAPKPVATKTTFVQGNAVKSQVDAKYPFDIQLRDKDGVVKNSKEVLATNGKPTVLLFWLTTCFPCGMELEAINKKYASWTEEADFNFYAISTDFEKNYPAFIKRVEEKQWGFQAWHDLNRNFRDVMPGALNGLPQVFLLDKNGEIVYHKRKYRSGDEDLLFAKIKTL